MGVSNHKLARENAFRGARLAIADHISMTEAAERIGSKRSSVQEAYTILMLGTPEEIAASESGLVGIGPTVQSIRNRTSPEARQAVARRPVRGVYSNQKREFEAQVWARLKDGIDALTSMPTPQDVIDIVKKSPQRLEYLSRKALTAHTWLEEFVNAWTK
jgi:hypothetical protein